MMPTVRGEITQRVRQAMREKDKEIQRLKNELAEKQKYVLQVERYGGQLRAALEAAPLASDIGMQYWTEYVSWYNGQRNQALEQE
jgi:hypothetical protein